MAKVGIFLIAASLMNVSASLAAEEKPAPEGKPVLSTLRGMVAVEMKKGDGYSAYYGGRKIYGVKSPASNDRMLVLAIPGAGEIRIPQSAVGRITPVPALGENAPAVPAAAGARAIRTTHLVVLKNGERLRGSLVPTPENEPLALEINPLGKVWIPRGRIAKVEENAGEFLLPEPAPETPQEGAQPQAAEPGQPPAPRETTEAGPEPVKPDLSPELKARIQEYVYNLTRWRHRDRTWAENQLIAIGAPTIPYLRALVHDPFDLVRRSLMRIIRDVGDPAGIPIAIEGLIDEDSFVRENAAEALRTITHQDLGYRPYDSLQRRLDAYRRWREWWEQETGPRA